MKDGWGGGAVEIREEKESHSEWMKKGENRDEHSQKVTSGGGGGHQICWVGGTQI